MSGLPDDSSHAFGERARFQQTLWGRVFAAGKQDSPESQEAMAQLYQTYYQPIYCFLRRSANDRQKAKELAHDFFGYLWEHNLVAKADPNRSKFRNFLIGVLKKFVLGEHKRQKTLKAGAGYQFVAIDAETAEGIYANEPAHLETPEKLFDKHWALKVIQQARDRLRKEFDPKEFAILEPCLTGDNEDRYASLAKQLGKTEEATRTAVSRLRARHRELIREVLSETLANPEDVDAEFKYLVDVLRACR
jgi:RNA polymerase sigma-70 factor (ECF subfamily)